MRQVHAALAGGLVQAADRRRDAAGTAVGAAVHDRRNPRAGDYDEAL
jgi:hypothetical protein